MLSFSKDLWHTNVPHNLSGNSMSHGALPCWHNKLSLRPSHRSHLMSEPEPKLRYFFSRALVLLMTCFMIKQKDNSAMFLLLLLFLDPTPTQAWVRTDCPEGKQISTWLVYTYNSFFHNLFEKARFCGNRISCVIDHSIKDPVTKVKFWSTILRCQEKAN